MSPPDIGGWQDHGGDLHDGAPDPGDDVYALRVHDFDADQEDRWYTILEPFPDWDELDDLYDYLDAWWAENYGEFA